MFCTQCGQQAGSRDKFCASCGNTLSNEPSSSTNASPEPRDPKLKHPPPMPNVVESVAQPQRQRTDADLQAVAPATPLATKTATGMDPAGSDSPTDETFVDMWKGNPMIIAIPEVGYTSLVLADVIFTSERMLVMPANRSSWDSGHVMILSAVGGPLGLLLGGAGVALWGALTREKERKKFDGSALNRLVREGLAISTDSSKLNIDVIQLNKGIGYPRSCATFAGEFAFGAGLYPGNIALIDTAKAKEMSKSIGKKTSAPIDVRSATRLSDWCKTTTVGRLVADSGWKENIVKLRKIAAQREFPKAPHNPR